jgi:hypothetical protein
MAYIGSSLLYNFVFTFIQIFGTTHTVPHWQLLWTNHKIRRKNNVLATRSSLHNYNIVIQICIYEIHSLSIVLVLILQAFSQKQWERIVTVRWEFHSLLPQLPAGMSHYNVHRNEHVTFSFRHRCSIDRRLHSIQPSLLDTPSKGFQVNSFPNNCVFNPTRNSLHCLSLHDFIS